MEQQCCLLFMFFSIIWPMCLGMRLNELQMVGTQDSYHIAPSVLVNQLLSSSQVQGVLGSGEASRAFFPQSLQFSLPRLDQQLQQGVRVLELDAFADHRGGLFTQAAVLKLAGQVGKLYDSRLSEPGFKVLFFPDVDYNSTCITLEECLSTIRRWSDANPRHLPITVYIELKQNLWQEVNRVTNISFFERALANSFGPQGLAVLEPVNVTTLMELEEVIESQFPLRKLVTPDDIRGLADSLADAVLGPAGRWPEIDTMRGRTMFVLHPGSAADLYLQEVRPFLEEALMFVADRADLSADPSTIFLDIFTRPLGTGRAPQNLSALENEIDAAAARITAAVQRGFLVRTRADSQTVEPRENFTYRRDAVLASGAHFVITNFLDPPTLFPSSYEVDNQGKAAWCNPVTSSSSSSPRNASAGNVSSASTASGICTSPEGFVL